MTLSKHIWYSSKPQMARNESPSGEMLVFSSVKGQKARGLSKRIKQTFVSWKHLIYIITGTVTDFSPGTGVWGENYVLQGGEETNGIDVIRKACLMKETLPASLRVGFST